MGVFQRPGKLLQRKAIRIFLEVANGDTYLSGRHCKLSREISSAAVWGPILNGKEIGCEEALFRRADHRLPARS